ncbi:MAG: pyridoxal-phosphate dependent enzyme [Candidatus Hydrogenedentes bacterium]|jgi:1-aminocyclopropane-1-carboxylate deaminase/D-cysteine desulfhydrase-like pyridoxal-dependent ACC family enzyme|nr:pyridoxal-phosphate dependent enzyme [Candidatus Hydrogenedentota bacterium]
MYTINEVLGLPYLSLAALPTPADESASFAKRHGIGSFFVKRDDQTHDDYGGNKIRKLGFLLAHAQSAGYKSVITFGGAGSNHALATATYAGALGMEALLVLGPQYNSYHVRDNLLTLLKSGAALFPCDWKETAQTAAAAIHNTWARQGKAPYLIPSGGSSPLGTMGYVNAALELGRQVEEGLLPEPDLLYVASGTMGTAVGLALGLRAANMKTRVVAIRVTTPPYSDYERAGKLFAVTNQWLHHQNKAFPLFCWDECQFTLRDEFFGGEYALFTQESVDAVQQARDQLNLQLEGTYTGKTMAAVIADGAAGKLTQSKVLFWNTYAGDDTATAVSARKEDWRALPLPLQRYFTEPVQPLDQR